MDGEEGEYNKQIRKNKMWEKRLNENYFKLFRRRNGRSLGERLRSRNATRWRQLAGVNWLPFACDWATTWCECRETLALKLEQIGSDRMDRLVNPFSVLGVFDYYLFIFRSKSRLKTVKKWTRNAGKKKLSKTRVKLCNIQSLFLKYFLCTF